MFGLLVQFKFFVIPARFAEFLSETKECYCVGDYLNVNTRISSGFLLQNKSFLLVTIKNAVKRLNFVEF